ncbi:VOC family protein [Virgibacillus kekensis]|uniref:VOC family protein n=1 Tax=Virgibacillus kekensis TaxID=202261 RepID=A0ABV9DHL1_9BACI
MITNIATVAIYVNDQQRAKKFWTEKAEFDVYAEHQMGPDAFWLEVGPKDAKSRLVIYPKEMMRGSENMRASIVFECDNVMETYEHMKTNGVEFKDAPQEMPWGTFTHFYDEDGNEFLLKG